MTRKQLDAGNALIRRIGRLRDSLTKFRQTVVDMDESPTRMTGFSINHHQSESLLVIEKQELEFLIDAFTKEIERLEEELSKI